MIRPGPFKRVSRCWRADLPWRIALLAGLIGSQGPEFAQQYRQRLGGALEELDRIVSEFDAEVRRQNLTPAEGLKRLEDNSDSLAARTRRGRGPGDRARRASQRADADPELGRSTRAPVRRRHQL
jgi:hypothetical protein